MTRDREAGRSSRTRLSVGDVHGRRGYGRVVDSAVDGDCGRCVVGVVDCRGRLVSAHYSQEIAARIVSDFPRVAAEPTPEQLKDMLRLAAVRGYELGYGAAVSS